MEDSRLLTMIGVPPPDFIRTQKIHASVARVYFWNSEANLRVSLLSLPG